MDSKQNDQTTKPQLPSPNNTSFDISRFSMTTELDMKLQKLLPENDQESRTIHAAKEILGSEYSTEEVKELVASFEYLINNWLEEFEKKVFDNKTLKEILQSV